MEAGNLAWIGGSAGVGLLLGVGYASFQKSQEPALDSGDTFRVVVGTTSYQPIPQDLPTMLYPAADPSGRKGKDK